MFKNFLIAALLCASAAVVSSAFAASGYGPAPRYNPLIGAPSSQRGQSVQTLRAEQADQTISTDDTARR